MAYSYYLTANLNIMKKTVEFILFGVLLLIFVGCEQATKPEEIKIIPQPQEVVMGKGVFTFKPETKVWMDSVKGIDPFIAEYLQRMIERVDGCFLVWEKEDKDKASIVVTTDTLLGKEEYRLNVKGDGIQITAGGNGGLLYALTSLDQLMVFNHNTIPVLQINDHPRFAYRGMHLDVSRHFYPKEFILKLIDALSYYKINRFHWHLTDGPGWRLEIKKYPRLTKFAAWRKPGVWKEWWGTDRHFVEEGTPGAYGGYYTHDDVKEVVEYARKRNITIIPEIEMPGHSEEVMAAYPQLSCTGKPYTQSEFCVGNEQTFKFIDDVLSEVVELFPSEYIHIGGDEAGKQHWKTCKKCRRRMKEKGLKNVDELQSYFIKRVSAILKKKGRKLLGWDEILQGGLAPGATVMSWRGEKGGIKAAKMKHGVVMTPGRYCYFDFYQARPETQPHAIGGYTPIKLVYSYDPIPKELTPEQSKYILGVQANVWTEHIPTTEHVEYMTFPRILAIAEVGWTDMEHRQWANFKPRFNAHIPYLRKERGINAFTLSNDVDILSEISLESKYTQFTLDAEKVGCDIRYTTDGSEPTVKSERYTKPLQLKGSGVLTAALFNDTLALGESTKKEYAFHLGIGKSCKYKNNYSSKYAAGGNTALIDGYRGSVTYADGRWQGITNDLDVVIDLGEIKDISRVKANFMQTIGPGVFFPIYVEISVSTDGVKYDKLCHEINPVSPKKEGVMFRDFGCKKQTKARYVRYFAKQYNGFLFADEIIIE